MSNPSIPIEHQETYEALMGEKKVLIGKVRRAVAGMVLFIVLSLGSGLILFSEQEGPIRYFTLGYALLLNLGMGICAYMVGKRPKAALNAAIVVLIVAHIAAPCWREIPISRRHRSGSNPNDTEPKSIVSKSASPYKQRTEESPATQALKKTKKQAPN